MTAAAAGAAAALEPGYRAVLRGVPTQYVDRFYRGDWPEWYPQVMLRSEDPGVDPPFTGTVTCKLQRYGQTIVDKPCLPDREFPWPATLQGGDYQVTVTASSADQTVVGGPYSVGFNGTFIKPVLSLDPVKPTARTQTVRMSLADEKYGGAVATPYSAGGFQVGCRVDGGATKPCLDGGTLAVPRTPGKHTITVTVTAPDGATATRSTSFTVAGVRTTSKATATYAKSTKRVVATSTVLDQYGGKAYGQVRFVLKKGTRSIGAVTATLNSRGVARAVFGKVRTTGKYTVVAGYRGSGPLLPSSGTARFTIR